MNEKFFDLKKEKQDRMINAALKIFALKGFRHASTDDMIKEARISKGLLFHYFGSKIGVYGFVYDYSVRYMILELKANVKENDKNFFHVIKKMEYAKMQAMRRYPYMQLFLNRCMMEDVNEALVECEIQKNGLLAEYERIENQIDYSPFENIEDGRRLYKMLELTMKGIMMERFTSASFQAELFYKEMEEYIEFAKKFTL